MMNLNPIPAVGPHVAKLTMCSRQISRAAAHAETISVLDRVRVPAAAAWFDEYSHQSPHGQRQWIRIARALALKPKFIVADHLGQITEAL